MLYSDVPPPRWWVDLQVAKELDIPYGDVLEVPLEHYYIGYVSLITKGLLSKHTKPNTTKPRMKG